VPVPVGLAVRADPKVESGALDFLTIRVSGVAMPGVFETHRVY
jgi:hypothetical protein